MAAQGSQLSRYQLRRLAMTDEQLSAMREKQRLRSRDYRSRRTEEQLAVERERRRACYRANPPTEQRLKRNERRRAISAACRTGSHVSRPLHGSSSPTLLTELSNEESMLRLQRHLQLEVNRLGMSMSASHLSTSSDFISVESSEGDRSVMPVFYVNFDRNWSYFEVPHQNFSSNEGSSSIHHIGFRLPRKPRPNCARIIGSIKNTNPLPLVEFRCCSYCNAKLFPNETQTMCCLRGKIQLPLPSAPPELIELYTSQAAEGVHFRKNIRAYNHVFAFTSMGVHIDPLLANTDRGVYTYRAQGSIYHRIGCLLPVGENRPRYLQMYIYDTDRQLENRISENNLVDRRVLTILKQVLDRSNPYVQVFRQISEQHDRDNLRLHLKESTPERHQYQLPTSSQVAAILVGGEEPSEMNERDIIVETRNGRLLNVADTAGFYDPLQYPLLHPYGNFGWDLNLYTTSSRRISTREYYSYIFQIRSNHNSILLRAGRLLQQYVVDQYVKIATQNLRYLRDHQSVVRAELYQGLCDFMNAGEARSGNIGRRMILPASYIGSPRDMQHRYNDAMALVCKYGKPDIFLTMTCNPNWEEIQRNLLPGQTAQDRPDLTTRVLMQNVSNLKKIYFKIMS